LFDEHDWEKEGAIVKRVTAGVTADHRRKGGE